MSSLIGPEREGLLWAAMLAAAAFGLWAERTRWGRRLSGAVVTLGTGFLLSNLRIVPSQAGVYDTVWSVFVPLAIPLLLFEADLRRILREAGPTLAAFVVGASGTVLGTFLAFLIVPLGPEGPKLAGVFCATYVGGSMNYVASAEALGLRSGDLLAAGVAADNLVMTLYFLVLFALPSWRRLRGAYPRRVEEGEDSGESSAADSGARPFRLSGAAIAVALSAAICAAGEGAGVAIGWPGGSILLITAASVALATVFPGRVGTLPGAREVGTWLMMVFFGVIGATANVGVVLRAGPVLFLFAALILTVHLAVLLGVGRLLRLDLAELVIASNANMGGPTTAAAMAAARRWHTLVTPAILCGTLGYAVATFVGVAVGHVLGA